MRDAKTVVKNQVAIAEFRIEDLAGAGFRVFFRRQLGGQSLFIFAGMLAFAGLGVWMMSSFVGGAWRGVTSGDGRKGPPICCLPFMLGFFALWLSVPLRALRAHWRGAMGREEWAFGIECITPATSLMNEIAPLPLVGEVRAGLSRVGGKWVVGISSRGHDLVVGPFRTEMIARQFEGELRARRPEWFAAAGVSSYGLPEAARTERLEPIVSWEVLPGPGGGGDFDVVLRRESSAARRRGGQFMALWLCGWVVGEVLVSVALAKHFMGLAPIGARSSKGPPPAWFFSVWLTGWTLAGYFAITKVVLHVRRWERWQFRHGRVVAGRNWVFSSRRTLVDEGKVHGRVVGAEVELVSAGVALRMGPFYGSDGAREMMQELARLRAGWGWEDSRGTRGRQ